MLHEFKFHFITISYFIQIDLAGIHIPLGYEPLVSTSFFFQNIEGRFQYLKQNSIKIFYVI